METEKKSKRKEWVKNAAIIFLSVMLVLTFFSNTIMNYSLPEVATAMVEPGSISLKIRGTGNLTSDDPYKITIGESRKIAAVAVKQGDVVEKDQVLFYLEDEDSAELEEAQKALEELLLAYSTSILNGDISNEAYQNIQNGVSTSTGEYQARIQEAKQKIEELQAASDSLEKQIAITSVSAGSSTDRQKELDQANSELEKAKNQLASQQEKLSAAQTQSVGSAAELTQKKYEAEEKFNGTAGAKQGFDTARSDLQILLTTVSASWDPQPEAVKAYEEITNIHEYMAILDGWYGQIPETDAVNREAFAVKMHDFQETYEKAYAAELEYQNAAKALETLLNATGQVSSLQSAVNSAKNYVNECQTKVNILQNEINDQKTDSELLKQNLQIQKTEKDAALEKAKTELAQLLTDISSELNLGNQNSIIREQREKIAKLKEKSVGAVITAPLAGTITSINKIAGESIVPEEEIAVMQPEGKGFSMSFSVTQEQAKKVTVGEKAEIQNSWYYDEISAVLSSIRPDPEGGNGKKLLVFNVTGDVQAGQSISLSIGQKSANYDLLVPNSAVREDNNGKFILTVESKSSPLGNRYIATRVDVEVLGSDDTKTAISAPLYGYEYVITTSTQPVEAGKQVRLAENQG